MTTPKKSEKNFGLAEAGARGVRLAGEMAGQYLSAVFELCPSRRQTAALERVRAAAEAVLWSALAGLHGQAEGVAAEADKKARRGVWRALQAQIARAVLAGGTSQTCPSLAEFERA